MIWLEFLKYVHQMSTDMSKCDPYRILSSIFFNNQGLLITTIKADSLARAYNVSN